MELDELKKKLSAKNEKLIASIVDKLSNKKLNFLVSNEMTFFRVKSLFSKEPITIEWIRSFENNSIFYDIGANEGEILNFINNNSNNSILFKDTILSIPSSILS